MKNKKLIAILTLLCFMFTLMPVAVFADEVNNTTNPDTSDKTVGTEVKTFEELQSAVTTSGVITITGTIELTETLTINNDVTINGGIITYGDGFSGTMFDIILDGTNTFGSLTLNDVTIDGGVKWTIDENNDPDIDTENSSGIESAASLIKVSGSSTASDGTITASTLNLNNSTIKNIYSLSYYIVTADIGGKVTLTGTEVKDNVGGVIYANDKSTVTAEKISVKNNYFTGNNGGFVYLNDYSKFTLESGEICNNKFWGRGGIVIGSCMDSEAIMNDGYVHDNESVGTASNVFGSVIYMERGGDFTMNGGKIIDNKGYRVSAIGSRWTDGFDTVQNKNGQGKTLSRLTLNGGEISGNTAKHNAFQGASILVRHLNTEIGPDMVINGDIRLDQFTYNTNTEDNTGLDAKMNDNPGSFTSSGTINGNVLLSHDNASDLWHNNRINDGAFPGDGTLNGVIWDTKANELYTKSGTLIDSPSKITKNDKVNDNDADTWTIPDGSTIKTSDGTTTYTTKESVSVDKDGNIVIPVGSSVETKDSDGNTDMKVTGPAIIGADGNIKVEKTIDENGKTVAGAVESAGVTVTSPATIGTDGEIKIGTGANIKDSQGNEIEIPYDITVPKANLGDIKIDTEKKEITLPENSSVTYSNGITTNLPNGGTVSTDGTTLPDGSKFEVGGDENGKAEIEVPAESNGDKDDVTTNVNGVTIPKGTIVKVTVTVKDGSSNETKVDVTVTGPATVNKDTGVVTVNPGGSIENGDVKITVGENGTATLTPDGDVVVGGVSSITVGNETATVPDSITVTVPVEKLNDVSIDNDGNIILSEGSMAEYGNTQVKVDKAGTVLITSDGIEVPQGEIVTMIVDGETVTVKGAAVVDTKGNITIKNGGTITMVNGTVVTAPANGSITIPADKLDEVTKDKNGNVVLPGGSVVTKDNKTTEFPYGGTIAADGTIKANPKPSTGGSGFSGSYNYAVAAPTVDNGSVKLSDSNAAAGETVTATVKPDNGYGVAEVIVTDDKGNVILVTNLGGGEYSFVMPTGKVNIDVICKPAITLTVGNKTANVFGKIVITDVAPIITPEGRTMLPIRFIAEALGADVSWNENAQTVTITKDGVKVQIVIGADYAYINGKKVKLDSPAFIANGRTYLPVRFVSEALGAAVNWDAKTKQVVIMK